MFIDFHTHVFPDSIAERAIAKLTGLSHAVPSYNGTIGGLRTAMKQGKISYSVVLPVVTAPKQFNSINTFAAENNGVDGIISFGGIHPENDDIENKLKQIKSLGLKGIKLHPDYQLTFVDDDKYAKIVSCAIDLGLIVVFHSGVDMGYPDLVHCTPKRALSLLNKVYGNASAIDKAQIVFAHMGASNMWEDVKEFLIDKNVYFDTAYCLDKMPANELLDLIRLHGANRILFASDGPWGYQEKFVEVFDALPLTLEEKEKISHLNAMKLLGM